MTTNYTTLKNPDPALHAFWQRRKIDPILQWKWESETKVNAAASEKGIHIGFIHFPDGAEVLFSR